MDTLLRRLSDERVGVWLDDLSRSRIQSGELRRMIDERSVVGVTTNPSIFHAAISGGTEYRAQMAELAALPVTASEAIRLMTCMDVRAACDVLRPVHDATGGRDGWVSIEVDPALARNPAGSLHEARMLTWLIDRPNVMIKVPATLEALPAVAACLAEGISVNVTLLFALRRFDAVMGSYLAGLERAIRAGRDVKGIASVASFFVSRVDTEVDRRLAAIGTPDAADLFGKAAIANARLAYEHFERGLDTPRWRALEKEGARPQRLLWASTGVKDLRYDDTRYVTELVAPDTVNTMPVPTLEAVADHGVIRGDTVRGSYAESADVIRRLASLGVSLSEVTTALERDGLRRFQEAWLSLAGDVDRTLQRLRATPTRVALTAS